MDWQLIQPIFHWLSDHPVWSGLFVFLIALTESLVIVGLIVPGTILMFGVGTLVGTGVLDVKLVLFLAFIGAVLGDGISFWFGAKYRDQIAGFWPFKNNPQILEKGKDFFTRHGGKSIFFGRFVGPVRPVIPAIAGMMHMPPKTFFAINIASAAGWAPFYLAPGILFGSSIGLASAIGSRLVIILISVFVGAVLLVFIVKKAMAFAMPKLEGWFDSLIQWSSRHALFSKVVISLVDPNKDTKNTLYRSLSILIFLMLFFTTFTFSVWSSWLFYIDEVVESVFYLLRSGPADEVMWVIQQSFSWLVLLLVMLNVLAGWYFSGVKKALYYFSVLLLVTIFSSVFVVFVYGFSETTALSFTSFLHLSLLAASLFFYAVISSESRPAQHRWPYYVVTIVIIFGFGFSDVYFSILSFSQSLVAVSLSSVWVLLFSLAYRRHSHAVLSVKFVSVSSIMITLLVASLMIANNANREILKVHSVAVKTISSQQWINEEWRNLSASRSDVFGKKKNSLNLQWQGSLVEIKQSLLEAGWQPSDKTTLRSLLYWLAPNPALDNIIRLPQTHDGKTESLLFVKTLNDQQQLVLQLWDSSRVNVQGVPIWLGAISTQHLVSDERWLSFFRVKDAAITAILADATITSKWKMLVRERVITQLDEMAQEEKIKLNILLLLK